MPDGGERGGEVEEIDKEQIEEKEVGDKQQGARACVMSADEDYDTDLEVEGREKELLLKDREKKKVGSSLQMIIKGAGELGGSVCGFLFLCFKSKEMAS